MSEPEVSPSFHYRAAGLPMASEIELRSLFPAPFTDADDPVEVLLQSRPLHAASANRRDARWDFFDGNFWLDVAGVAEFLALGGKRLLIRPHDGASLDAIGLVVAGTATAALVHQRGDCVFHASAVAVGPGAALFMAPSGTGKSTLAMLLSHHGHALLADDLCRIAGSEEGVPRVYPDGRKSKLWPDAIARHDLRAQDEILADTGKFYVTAPTRVDEPRPVVAIYFLTRCDDPAAQPICELSAATGMGLLLQSAFRPRQVERFGLSRAYFDVTHRLATQTRLYRLTLAPGSAATRTLLSRLAEQWRGFGLL